MDGPIAPMNLFCGASPQEPVFDCYSGELKIEPSAPPSKRYQLCAMVNFGECRFFEQKEGDMTRCATRPSWFATWLSELQQEQANRLAAIAEPTGADLVTIAVTDIVAACADVLTPGHHMPVGAGDAPLASD
jgi:hypothetical protein